MTTEERRNQAIAAARANGTRVSDPSLDGLGSPVEPCAKCDGTGLPKNTDFRHIEFCTNCNGRGYVSVAQPKLLKGVDFDVCKTTHIPR